MGKRGWFVSKTNLNIPTTWWWAHKAIDYVEKKNLRVPHITQFLAIRTGSSYEHPACFRRTHIFGVHAKMLLLSLSLSLSPFKSLLYFLNLLTYSCLLLSVYVFILCTACFMLVGMRKPVNVNAVWTFSPSCVIPCAFLHLKRDNKDALSWLIYSWALNTPACVNRFRRARWPSLFR